MNVVAWVISSALPLASKIVGVDQDGNLFALRAPDLLAGRRVERREERVALDVALHDHHVLVDDRRAADAPLVVRIEEPAGVQDAEIFLPEQLAVEVVTRKDLPIRTRRRRDLPSVTGVADAWLDFGWRLVFGTPS